MMDRLRLLVLTGCTLLGGCGARDYTVVDPAAEALLTASSEVVVDGQLVTISYYHGSNLWGKARGEPDHVEFTVRIEQVVKGKPAPTFQLWLKLRHAPAQETQLFNSDGSGFRSPMPVRIGFDRGLFDTLSDIQIMRRSR